MLAVAPLLNLLPTLALLGAALTGLEGVPSALAHSPVHRSPDHHKHLAQRQRAAAELANKQSKRSSNGLLRRKADGSVCRVRGAAYTPSASVAAAAASSSSSVAAASASSAAFSAQTSAAAPTQVNAIAAPSPSVAAPSPPAAASAAASAASSAAPAPAPVNAAPATGGATSNGGWANTGDKYGFAWPNGDWATAGSGDYIGNYIGSRASWYYTWSPWNVGSGDALGLEFVPTLWGPKQLGDWYNNQASWPKTVKNALFFNEPNEHSQCNMAAADSVSYWMHDYLPLRQKGIKLGSAAPTNAPSGVQWVLDFEKACVAQGHSQADCSPDFAPIHWYDVTAAGFKQYVQDFHQKTGHDIWVTEYACQNFNGGAQCSEAETWALHQEMAAWFDSQDYVKRYSPFGVMKQMQGVNQFNALMGPNGGITALGSWYMNSS